MKVIGRFMGEQATFKNLSTGGFLALDLEWFDVETFSGQSVAHDPHRCYLQVGASYVVAQIYKSNGSYMELEDTHSLAKDIVTKDVVDLDDYGLGFYCVFDIRPDSISVKNECDEYTGEEIPLRVIGTE